MECAKIRLFLRGKIFTNFTNLRSSIREIFSLELFLFSGYSTQSVTIWENFVLEKLGKAQFAEIFPLKNNPLYAKPYCSPENLSGKLLRLIKNLRKP